MKRQKVSILVSALLMLMFILDSRTALAGAKEGIEICIRTLIPSLFPFFVLSGLITGNLRGISVRGMNYMEQIFRIPKDSGHLLMLGFLAGYPVGAKNADDCCRRSGLPEIEIQRMAVICNNPGPAFLFGILSGQFSSTIYIWMLWALQIISSLFIARLTAQKRCTAVSISPAEPTTVVQAMNQAIRSTAAVCGWVIMIRILLEYLNGWFLYRMPPVLQILCTGFLELSNGCLNLGKISAEGLRFSLAAVLLTFGGCCVTLQTGSVCRTISISKYLYLKGVQSFIAYCMSLVIQFLFAPSHRITHPIFYVPALILLPILIQSKKMKKNSSSIPATYGV